MACKGIHDRFKAKRQGPFSDSEQSYGIYRAGMKRCKPCGVYYDMKDFEKQGLNPNRCPCCKKPLKSKPNNKKFRDKMEARIT